MHGMRDNSEKKTCHPEGLAQSWRFAHVCVSQIGVAGPRCSEKILSDSAIPDTKEDITFLSAAIHLHSMGYTRLG